MTYKIAIIKMGFVNRYIHRIVIVSTPTHCFVLFRHKGNEISIWSEGLTAEEGKQLVLSYKDKIQTFGKLRNQLFEKNECLGFSERGFFSYDEFKELLESFNLEEKYIELLYDSIYKNDSELIIDN